MAKCIRSAVPKIGSIRAISDPHGIDDYDKNPVKSAHSLTSSLTVVSQAIAKVCAS